MNPSHQAFLNEPPDENLDYLRQSNERLERFQTRMALIPIDDPIGREMKRQRAIVEKALLALGRGDSAGARQLLQQLRA